VAKLDNNYDLSLPLDKPADVLDLINQVLRDLRESEFHQTADKIEEIINGSVEERVTLVDRRGAMLSRKLTDYEKMELTATVFMSLWQEMIQEYGKVRRVLGRDENVEQTLVLAGEVVTACKVWLHEHVPYGAN
jgi:hypothetical protein